jgi:hypothetical protein
MAYDYTKFAQLAVTMIAKYGQSVTLTSILDSYSGHPYGDHSSRRL